MLPDMRTLMAAFAVARRCPIYAAERIERCRHNTLAVDRRCAAAEGAAAAALVDARFR